MGYALLRYFHAASAAVMVPTASIERELREHHFNNLARWSRGVDTTIFQPYEGKVASYDNLQRPILLYVGRVAVEKNLRDFLTAATTGTQVIIGDGPDLALLKHEFPKAVFLGAMEGEELARHYAAADVFVFPSTTDTFGLVLLEAAASGLRIASYPAPGPADLFSDPTTHNFAALDADLRTAIHKALALPHTPSSSRAFAESFSWQACTEQFFKHLSATKT